MIFLSLNSFSQLLKNRFPAKEIPTTYTRFGVTIFDEFHWMDNNHDYDVYIWRNNQNLQTREYLTKGLIDSFKLELDKIHDFKKENESKLKIPRENKINKKRESKLYKIEISEIQETGTGYGAINLIHVFNKKDNILKETLVGYNYEVIDWLDDETFVYSNYRSRKLKLGNTHYIGHHKVGEHPSLDKIIYNARVGDWLQVNTNKDNYYLIIWDLSDRSQIAGKFNVKTGELSNEFSLGSNRTQLGEKQEDNGFFRYFSNYEKHNYGLVEKINFDTGVVTKLFETKDFVAKKLEYISENNYLVIGYRDAESVVAFFKNGELIPIDAPKKGNISLKGIKKQKAYLSYENYENVLAVYELNLKNLSVKKYKSVQFSAKIEAKKIHYTAVNGQKAAIWLVKKKDTKISKETPTLLYGYGGWYHTDLPEFNKMYAYPWLEKGGVLAVVAVPGSLAYGMAWNKIAKAENRVNSFDSFALAGLELISRGYTSPSRLGMYGASNGGLLIAGTLQRHPKLFKAAVPMVAVVDLLNCNAKSHIWEYGDPCKQKDFEKLVKISPYQTITPNEYPSVLVATADNDGVTIPSHSYKYAARLQKNQQSKNPILLFSKPMGGHSRISGSVADTKEYLSIIYAFFAKELGLVEDSKDLF